MAAAVHQLLTGVLLLGPWGAGSNEPERAL